MLALRGSYLVFSELPLPAASDGRGGPVVVVVAWVPMGFLGFLWAFTKESHRNPRNSAVAALGSYGRRLGFLWLACFACLLAMLALLACFACLLCFLALLACFVCLLCLLALLACGACLQCLLAMLA